jgi:hypothetical protein
MANPMSENTKRAYVRIIVDRMKDISGHDLVKISAKAKRLYDEVGEAEYSKLIFKQIKDSAGLGNKHHVGIAAFLKGIHNNNANRIKDIKAISYEKTEAHKLIAMKSVYNILETELTPYEVLRCVYSKPEAEELAEAENQQENAQDDEDDEDLFDNEEEEEDEDLAPRKLIREFKSPRSRRPSTFTPPTYGFGTPKPPFTPRKHGVKKTISKKKVAPRARISRTILKKPVYVEDDEEEYSSLGLEPMDEDDEDLFDNEEEEKEEEEKPSPPKRASRKLFFDLTRD